jgi:endonuclease/exonuclease/phosphatase family metal-dependent hydrolase
MYPLKLATYNIHKGVQGLGPLRRLEIHNQRTGLHTVGADVVCLQEVRAFNHRLATRLPHWPTTDHGQTLAGEAYQCVYKSNAVTRFGEHGNAVLSKWPVSLVGHYDVSDHRLEQRGLLHVCVDTPAGQLHVINVHLGLIAASRRRQVQHLLNLVKEHVPADMPLVVAGDFNDWAQQLHTPLSHAQLVTVQGPALKTFPSRLPALSMDRIYGRGVQLLSATVPRGQPWYRWSDHLPLVMDMQMPMQIPMQMPLPLQVEVEVEVETTVHGKCGL